MQSDVDIDYSPAMHDDEVVVSEDDTPATHVYDESLAVHEDDIHDGGVDSEAGMPGAGKAVVSQDDVPVMYENVNNGSGKVEMSGNGSKKAAAVVDVIALRRNKLIVSKFCSAVMLPKRVF